MRGSSIVTPVACGLCCMTRSGPAFRRARRRPGVAFRDGEVFGVGLLFGSGTVAAASVFHEIPNSLVSYFRKLGAFVCFTLKFPPAITSLSQRKSLPSLPALLLTCDGSVGRRAETR